MFFPMFELMLIGAAVGGYVVLRLAEFAIKSIIKRVKIKWE